ncbi:hypothetical protein GCM10009715_21360 [Paeniglutamicibacter psychrophenolicus]|nr:helix-turn-helix transcriptional regulator [Paeniglutamicibacter psychrophenolicus]
MRLKRQLSKTAFAELIGLPASTITRIESGVVEPTYAMLQRIASGAGFRLSETLTESGSDLPYAAALERIRNSTEDERPRLIGKLAQTANLAPVAKRRGARLFALESSLEEFLQRLTDQGTNPVVSSLEAVSGDISQTSSFTPVVYVDNPEEITDLPDMTPSAKAGVVVLPSTDSTKRYVRHVQGTAMLSPEWGMLDALASPGRQADVALSLLPAFAKSARAAK